MTTKRYSFTKTAKGIGNITVPGNITGKLQGILFVGSTVIILNFIFAFFYNSFYFFTLRINLNLIPLSIEDFLLAAFNDLVIILITFSSFLFFLFFSDLKFPKYLSRESRLSTLTFWLLASFMLILFLLPILLWNLNWRTIFFTVPIILFVFMFFRYLRLIGVIEKVQTCNKYCILLIMILFLLHFKALFDIVMPATEQPFVSIDSKSYPLIRTLEKGVLVLNDKSIVFVANNKIDVVEYKIGSKVYEMLIRRTDEKDDNTTIVPDKVDTNPKDKPLTLENKDSDAVSVDKVDNKASNATPVLDNVEVPTLKE